MKSISNLSDTMNESMQPDWQEIHNTLQKTLTFSNFQQALLFVNSVGEIAENLGHHPDICIKDYKNVFISTTTHDKGNVVTEKDYQLAKAIDDLI